MRRVEPIAEHFSCGTRAGCSRVTTITKKKASYWRHANHLRNPTQHLSSSSNVSPGLSSVKSTFLRPVAASPSLRRPLPSHEIDMLPPFRVRTLRPSASPGLGRSRNKKFNALVRITAPEYDNTLRVCPEAALKYLDEEDGEIVTVGSSLELIQCLESPLQQNPHYCGLIPRVSSLPSRRDFSEALAAPAVHQRIFHIESRPSSVQLWREIEERSEGIYTTPLTHNISNEAQIKGLFRHPRSVQPAPNSIPDPCPMNAEPRSSMSDIMLDSDPESDLKVHMDASDDLTRLQELDYRITSLDANICPNISQAQEEQSRNQSKIVVGVPFNPADSSPCLQELAGYGPKSHLRRDPPAIDDQPGSNLKPSLKKNHLQHRDESLASQQQHDGHAWWRSAGARNDPCEFHEALAHAPETYGRETNDKQSLLNLFEAELARIPSPSAHNQNASSKGNVHVYDNIFPMRSALKSKAPLDRSTQLNNTDLDQTPQTPAQVCIQALDLGLGAALTSFHACMNDIAESVHQASAAVHSADRSRIGSAMASFRSFIHELAASANVVEQRLKSDTAKFDHGETITTPNKDRCAEFLSRKFQGQVVGGESIRMTTTREPNRSTATEEMASLKDVAFSGRSKSVLSSQHDTPFSGKAQGRTTIPDEDRIALRPSLNKSNMLFKQACDSRGRSNTMSSDSYPRTGVHNASESFMERVYSGEELNKSTVSHKVINRFPISKQLEDEGLAAAHRFPPLPSMEALEPHRPNSQPRVTLRLITRDGSPCLEKDSDHEISSPEPLGSTSVTNISEKCESSGEFFNRMTGLGKESIATHPSSLQASVNQASAGPDGGAAQDDLFLGRQNVTYRQTVSGLARYDNSVNNTRRPYSENFSGEGRIGWDTFLRQGSESLITNQEAEPISSLTFERGYVLPSGVPCISSHNIHNDEAASEARRVDVNHHSVQSNLNGRGDAAYVRKVQACVTQLHILGYGSNAVQGGFERLTVYAQAAEGDLISAIDIIDEEQRAYKLGLPV